MTKAYWDAFYGRLPEGGDLGEAAAGWLTEAPRRSVVDAVGDGFLAPPGRVLDVGCGLGGSAAWLAGKGFEVTAIDLSKEAVERARLRSERVRWLVADCTAPSALGPFDAVVDCGTLHQLREPEQRAYVANLRAWMSAGARLLLTMRHGAPLFATTTRAMLLEKAADLFADGFSIQTTAEIDMGEDAGSRRPGVAFRIVRDGGRS